jgi:hypothetical protein
VLIAWLILSAGAAGAAADDLEQILQSSRLDASQQALVRGVFDEALEQGIPPSMLLPRLEEGLSKRVAAARLVGALRREAGFLVTARGILTDEAEVLLADEANWIRTANLLAGELAVEEIRALIRLSVPRPRDYRHATYLYVALLDWGLPREQARGLLKALMGSSIPGEQLSGVLELLAEGRRLRVPPEEVVERVRGVASRVKSVEELERLVLY